MIMERVAGYMERAETLKQFVNSKKYGLVIYYSTNYCLGSPILAALLPNALCMQLWSPFNFQYTQHPHEHAYTINDRMF
jgi:hypothetical protein